MKSKIKIISTIIFIVASATLIAQDFSNVGTAGGTFLKIPVEPVGAALANSNIASVEGVAGLYWNPAAIADIEGTEILFSHVSWIADTRVSFVGFGQKLGPGSIGLSFTALTMAQMEITTETEPDGTGQFFSAGSYEIGLSYGLKVIDNFNFGGTMKYIYEYIWDTNGSTLLFDLGSVYKTDFYNLKIGMRLSNFGGNTQFSGEPIDNKADVIEGSGISYSYDPRLERVSPEYSFPQLFNAGISLEPFTFEKQKLTVTAAINDYIDNNAQLLFGAEYVWDELLFLRAGYKTGYDEQGISAGVGLKTSIGPVSTTINFAYSPFGKLSDVMFIGLRLSF